MGRIAEEEREKVQVRLDKIERIFCINSGNLKCTICQGHYDFSFSDFYFYICLLCRGIKVMPLIDCFHFFLSGNMVNRFTESASVSGIPLGLICSVF